SGDSVEYQRIDVRLELVCVYGGIDCLSPKLHRDIVRDELASTRTFKEGFAHFCARVDGSEYVATSAMKVTGNRAERFALGAFAAARRAKKNEGIVSHFGHRLYPITNPFDKRRHPKSFDFVQDGLSRGIPRQ